MYTPINPSFTIYKWGLRGSKLYRRVFVMISLSSSSLCQGLATICDYGSPWAFCHVYGAYLQDLDYLQNANGK